MTEHPAPPDPMEDPEGWALWCELRACTYCDGLGEDYIEDEGDVWVCPRCDGTGIEPGYEAEQDAD